MLRESPCLAGRLPEHEHCSGKKIAVHVFYAAILRRPLSNDVSNSFSLFFSSPKLFVVGWLTSPFKFDGYIHAGITMPQQGVTLFWFDCVHSWLLFIIIRSIYIRCMAAAASVCCSSSTALHLTCFNVCSTTFRVPYKDKLQPLSYSVSFFVLRTITISTYNRRRCCCCCAVSYHGFSKVGLPEAANNHYFFGRLSKPDHSHNNPGYHCPAVNTLYQVTPRE